MNGVLASLFILISVVARAETDFGPKLEFYTKNNKPQFGIQMYEEGLSATITVSGNDISKNKPVKFVAIQFADKTTGNPISDQMIVSDFGHSVNLTGSQAFTASVTGESATKIQSQLKNSVLLITTYNLDVPVFSGYVDLSNYCTIAKDNFIDLDSGSSGCP